MKTIVIIIQKKKKKLWKNKTNKIRFIHFPLGRGQRANWANGQTEKMLRNQSNQCESVPASTSSSPRQTNQTLHRHVWGVTATLLRCFNTAAETGWADVTVWASVPDFSSSSSSWSSSSSSSGPQQLLQGQCFRKGGSCRGVSLRDYVVLIRLSSCLMAAGRGEKTGTWLGLISQDRVIKHDV